MVRRFQPRATGLVRTLVVASATLAILVVCFSIYQSSQLDPQVARLRRIRTPQLPSSLAEPPHPPPMKEGRGEVAATDSPGVAMDQGVIGPGEKIHITLYPRKGTRARLELAVRDWTPVAGSANEFLLSEPDIRMRTRDGHAVRVTAQRGTLEAQRKSGGGLEPKRGKLIGDVVIRYDRLSEADRAKLPKELRNHIDPADLVRADLEEMEFDLEYSKLIVPGRWRLSARDMELDASDLEIRFDEAENRVESMRISRGGQIELREQSELTEGGLWRTFETNNERRLTLVEWLRASIQAKLDTQQKSQPATKGGTAVQIELTVTNEGLPVFRTGAEDEDAGTAVRSTPPIRYYARFEGNIQAKQLAGDQTRARLEADSLEIVRDVSDMDKARMRSGGTLSPTEGEGVHVAPANERIVLEWNDRLVVEACSPDDERCAGDMRSKISANGLPVKLSLHGGSPGRAGMRTAVCTKLTYDPDESKAQLYGTEAHPVVVDYAGQGTLTGLAVYSKRTDNDMYVRVTGPGTLQQESTVTSGSDTKAPATVAFTDELEAHGRFVTRTTIDFSGRISSREERVLDRAVFAGDVRMRQADTGVDADRVALTFGSLRSGRESIEQVTAQGHVVMMQGADRLTCREIDIALTTDSHGQTVPRTATAWGDVAANQGDRVIQARDKLIIDFEMIDRPLPPFDAVKAYAAAVEAGHDVTQIDWEARRREHESRKRTKVGVKRLQAFGEVTILDPTQGLDLSAEEVDGSVADGRDIEKALIIGLEDRPAVVRLDTISVTGREIRLDVPDEWAEVPGPGKLTFLSQKDLDGRKMAEPIPIVITWTDWMKYQGRKNSSVFSGNVHATSETSTTFDCDRLIVEFDDVPASSDDKKSAPPWRFFQEIVHRVSHEPSEDTPRLAGPPSADFSKQPAYLLATGHAVALTSEVDPESGILKSRARIAGPMLSVNLRPDVSKMQIEGPGTLLLEDNRPIPQREESTERVRNGLFGVDEDSGPSNTLIEWDELMWYDFSIDRTRFEGNVRLKHFSGAELLRIRSGLSGDSAEVPAGRATFLTCDVLTVDFLDREGRSHRPDRQRMGRLSSDRLRQFQATGSVILQDQSEGLFLTADRVVYWKDRNLLAIYGAHDRRAHIVTQKPGQLPSQASVEQLFYNLSTGQMELSKFTLQVR